MKKIFIIICLVFCVFVFTGCEDTSKKDMDLVSIEVKDSSGNVVTGEYKSLYDIRSKDDLINKTLINSAPPRYMFYSIDADIYEVYTCTFVFESINNRKLDKVVFRSGTIIDQINEFEIDDIKTIDGKYYVTIEIVPRRDIVLYEAVSWISGDKDSYFGSAGNNTYIRGLFLDFNLEEV